MQVKSSGADIQQLRCLLQDVQPDAPGASAFVWVYFIGAASSETAEDCDFFRQKLMGIYSHIGFENISMGLESLNRVLNYQGGNRWTRVLPSISTLVM
jgi:hypothetical protein